MGKAQAQNGVVSGVIDLDNSTYPYTPGLTVTFEFISTSSASALVATYDITTYDAARHGYFYHFDAIPYGTYNVAVKLNKWLRTVKTLNVNAASVTLNFSLLGGDANADNSVDSTDFGILIGAYNSEADLPDSGYDPNADFNYDGHVDSTDFGILFDSFNAVGAPYQIVLNPPALAAPRQITLQWKLYTSNGNAIIAPPTGTTFNIYRSTRAAHTASSFFTVTSDPQGDPKYQYHTDAATNVISYTDKDVPGPGEYYYQIVASITNPSASTGQTVYYALSNEAQYVPASNPVIEPDYPTSGVYTITGFQSDLSAINYQATVTNGLLNSYKVNGHELFHVNPATGKTLPIQFAAGLDFHTLSNGSQSPPLALQNSSGLYNLDFADPANASATILKYVATPVNLRVILTPGYNPAFCLPLGSEHDAQANESVYAAQDRASAGVGYDGVSDCQFGLFPHTGNRRDVFASDS